MAEHELLEDRKKSKKHSLFTEADQQRLSGSGTPLPAHHKHLLEAQLGADLSHVKVHTGPNAERMTRALGVRAFTFGNRIFFAPGEYDPAGVRGFGLLAHEAAHMIQQNKGK